MLSGSLVEYIASQEGDLKSLAEGVSPEVDDTTKELIDFILKSGNFKKARQNKPDKKAQMEMHYSTTTVANSVQVEAEAAREYMGRLDN